MAKEAIKVEASVGAAERKLPELEAKHVTVSDAGHAWREVLVRLPKDMTADDLRDPKIWKRVQAVRNTALIKFDNLLIFTFDESQYIRAIVTHATSTEAHLPSSALAPSANRPQRSSMTARGKFIGTAVPTPCAGCPIMCVSSIQALALKAKPSRRCANPIPRWPNGDPST